MRDAQRIQRFGRLAHRRPVGLAAHDDGDDGTLIGQGFRSRRQRRALAEFADSRKDCRGCGALQSLQVSKSLINLSSDGAAPHLPAGILSPNSDGERGALIVGFANRQCCK
ncbi:MAG: hypothetical protein E5V65_19225, partial [Mesorhizobium sp.]